jgi:IclR family transcriptional regulator, KDG regulon repressor
MSSATRVLEVLEFICLRDTPEATIGEIAKHFGISAPTAFRTLDALHRFGYLDHRKGSSTYSLGYKLVELGWGAISKHEITSVSASVVQDLVTTTGESAILGVLSDNEVLYLNKQAGKGMRNVSVAVETRAPLHCTALGKILLAFSESSEAEEILNHIVLKRFTSRTVTDIRVLRAQLDQIRKTGIAEAFEEYIEGTCAIATPIRDGSNQVVAALSLVIPTIRCDSDQQKRFLNALMESGTELSRRLGRTRRES